MNFLQNIFVMMDSEFWNLIINVVIPLPVSIWLVAKQIRHIRKQDIALIVLLAALTYSQSSWSLTGFGIRDVSILLVALPITAKWFPSYRHMSLRAAVGFNYLSILAVDVLGCLTRHGFTYYAVSNIGGAGIEDALIRSFVTGGISALIVAWYLKRYPAKMAFSS